MVLLKLEIGSNISVFICKMMSNWHTFQHLPLHINKLIHLFISN